LKHFRLAAEKTTIAAIFQHITIGTVARVAAAPESSRDERDAKGKKDFGFGFGRNFDSFYYGNAWSTGRFASVRDNRRPRPGFYYFLVFRKEKQMSREFFSMLNDDSTL
jgi:hypothetical protein